MLPDVFESEYYRADVVRKIVIDGHETAYVKVTMPSSGDVEYMVTCECARDSGSGNFNPWERVSCGLRSAATYLRRWEVSRELSDKYGLQDFIGMFNPVFPYVSDELKNAIVELFERSQRNAWLDGNTNYLSGVLISDILSIHASLSVSVGDIWTCVNILEREGKLACGTGMGVAWVGLIVPYDARRKRKNPKYPYLAKEIGSWTVKVFSPQTSGFEPLEWLVRVCNRAGKISYEERIPLLYHPKWPSGIENKAEAFHATDVARLTLALAELEEKVWNGSLEEK